MSDREEGIPFGWKRVRIGTVKRGETSISFCGDPLVCDFEASAKNYVIIEKIEPPKPTYIPWTFETCPVGAIIWHKTQAYKGIIIAAGVSRAWLGNSCYSYDSLLEDFELLQKDSRLEASRCLDGTPCGTVQVQE